MEPISSITTAFVKAAITQLSKKIIDSAFSLDPSIFGNMNINIDDLNNFIKRTHESILRIRTIHSSERDVYLDDIYSPITITTSTSEPILVDELFYPEHSKIINIIGSAGQGKSTIMRKIYSNGICRYNKFPLFIELRRLAGEDIIEYINTQFQNEMFKSNIKSIEKFIDSKNITLLLDGFDEINIEQREQVLSNIIRIKNKYSCNIITSSRPDTEICNKSLVLNCYVEKLTIGQIEQILYKIDNNNNAKEIFNSLKNNNRLIETLISPILVNLLYISYPFLDSIPSSPVEFYDKLFLTLYSRHDKVKGFNRKKYSKINTDKCLEIFNGLSFFSLINDDFEFTEDLLNKYLIKSIQLASTDEAEIENIKNDIIYVTCLIQRDGYDRYVYLHKSVQEFHAAKFISRIHSNHKNSFYQKISSIIEGDSRLDTMMSFLKEIDKDDFEQLLQIPIIDKLDLGKKRNINQVINKSIRNAKVSSTLIYDEKESITWLVIFDSKDALALLSLFESGSRLFISNEVNDFIIYELEELVKERMLENLSNFEKYKSRFEDDLDCIAYHDIPLTSVISMNDESMTQLKDLIFKFLTTYINETHKPLKKKKAKITKLINFELS